MPRKGVAAQMAALIPTLFILGSLTAVYVIADVLQSLWRRASAGHERKEA